MKEVHFCKIVLAKWVKLSINYYCGMNRFAIAIIVNT